MKYILSHDFIQSGDIIRIQNNVYSNSIISEKWEKHFIRVNQFLKVISISNNGNITAKDKTGKMLFNLYAASKIIPVTAIYKPL